MKDRDVAERAVVALARTALDQASSWPTTSRRSSWPRTRIVGLEALVRWESPQRGIVQPNDFIRCSRRTAL